MAVTVNRKSENIFGMTELAYSDQKEALEVLLRESNLTVEELAARAHVLPETFRKYLGGYQKCGKQTMVAIELAAQLAIDSLKHAAGAKTETSAIHDQAIREAGRLLRLPEAERGQINEMIDRLTELVSYRRGARASSAKVSGDVAPASASAAARSELRSQRRSRGVDAPSVRTRGRGRGAQPGPSRRPEAGGEVPK